MLGRSDVEAGASEDVLNRYAIQSPETEALLPTSRPEVPTSSSAAHSKASHFASKSCGQAKFGVLHVSAAFVLGSVACLLAQYAICGTNCFSSKDGSSSAAPKSHAIEGIVSAFAPPYVGSTEVHNFPPTKPTNAYPSLFPSNVGYAGGTPTGAEAAVVVTAPAYPLHTGQCSHQLLQPAKLLSQNEKGDDLDDGIDDFKKKKKSKFDLFRSWGNLSPWYSVERGALVWIPAPKHGARYPTAWSSYAGPAKFATKLHKSPELWNASGSLEFLNDWTYKLGEELLTPFGRQQLYDLGISTRMKYGFLLQNFTEKNVLPVFRTESQDRMLASAMNFAIGFFGYPFDGQYQQLITIEEKGFNNTLAPYKTCPNADIKTKSERGTWYLERWAAIYLKDAHKRLQKQFGDFDLTIEDVHTMQQLCPYETVALGYSKFCELFTEEEWEGFNYALDLQFWYGSAFGSPVARVQGIGYVQELVARLTHTPIETHNSSTNATINDNPITFPLGQSLYVDATHEVVVLNIITALNLSTLAASGTLPYTHIPKDRSFKVAELAPFATNMQFQILECTSLPGPQIRIIINDAVVPLTGIRGCAEQKDGMCPVETFVKAQKEIIKNTDWTYDCHGDWTVPPGTDWETTTGDAPRKQ